MELGSHIYNNVPLKSYKEIFQTKGVEKKNETHNTPSSKLYSENRIIYEFVWKNVVEMPGHR
jgi:hypothetical protein